MHAHLHSLVHTHTQAPIFAILLVFSLAIIALSNFNGLFKSLINALIEPLAFSKGGSLLKFSFEFVLSHRQKFTTCYSGVSDAKLSRLIEMLMLFAFLPPILEPKTRSVMILILWLLSIGGWCQII